MTPTTEPAYPAATMAPDEVPEDINEAFALVEGLLFDQVHKFHLRYGGDRDDLIGEAHEAFMKGHAEFITGKTNGGKAIKDPYATSIRRWIWFEMFDRMRSRIKANDATEAIGDRDFALDTTEDFNVNDWGLGEDALRVVKLLLEPPRSIRIPAERKGGSPRNYRSTLREWLTDRGWTATRINGAFAEIKHALR